MNQIAFNDFISAYSDLKNELDEAYQQVMASGWYVLGEQVLRFEEEYAQFCGTKYCVGVANGLEAMQLALYGWGIGPGDEVIVPSNTYIATWLAVSHVGATPVPVEPEPKSFNIDPARIEEVITCRTRAILVVHLYGQPADMDPINSLAQRYGIKVLEDNAQAHGATYHGRVTGALGHAAAHSFYPTKNLGAIGDGGAITTDDDVLADRLRVLRNYGSRKRYYNEEKGFNSRLDELQAAFLRVKLRHLPGWNMKRQWLASHYIRIFKSMQEGVRGRVLMPQVQPGIEHVWHLFVIRTGARDLLKDKLADEGVQTLIHYPVPPHLSQAYADEFWGKTYPLAEQLSATVLSLPMHPFLKEEAMGRIMAKVAQFASE